MQLGGLGLEVHAATHAAVAVADDEVFVRRMPGTASGLLQEFGSGQKRESQLRKESIVSLLRHNNCLLDLLQIAMHGLEIDFFLRLRGADIAGDV